MALGRIPDPQGRSALQGLLVDDEPAVRRAAAFSLGLLGDPRGAAGAVRRRARQGPRDRRAGRRGPGQARGADGGRAGGAPAAARRRSAGRGCCRISSASRTTPSCSLAERGLDLPDPELHARAAYALAREPGRRRSPRCARCSPIPTPRVRAWAARALGIVGGEEDLARAPPAARRRGPDDPGPLIQALRSARALAAGGKAKPIAGWTPAAARAARRSPARRAGERRRGRRSLGLARAGRRCWRRATATGEMRERGDGRWWPWRRARHPRALELATAAAGRPRTTPCAPAPPRPRERSACRRRRGARAAGRRSRARGCGPPPSPPGWPPDRQGRGEVAPQGARPIPTRPCAAPRSTGWPSTRSCRSPTSAPALPAVYRKETQEEGLAAVEAVAARAEGEPLERGAADRSC